MQQRTFSQYPVTSSIAPYEFVWSDGSVDASDLDEYLSDSPIGYKNLGLMQMQRRHAHHQRRQNYPVRHQRVHMRPHSFYQKQIYPVKDSHSYIEPYSQRDHSFSDNQYDTSDEVQWVANTKTLHADYVDQLEPSA